MKYQYVLVGVKKKKKIFFFFCQPWQLCRIGLNESRYTNHSSQANTTSGSIAPERNRTSCVLRAKHKVILCKKRLHYVLRPVIFVVLCYICIVYT